MPDHDMRMPKESAVNYLIRIVKDWVSNGTYKSGDKLPSESELCQLTGVSRGSIREAMKILAALGVVDIRRGNGTYITMGNSKPPVEPLLLNLRKSAESIKDLMDFREQIEKSVMELIIRNASDTDIDRLDQANRLMKEEIEGDGNLEKLVSLDLMFHQQLASSTGNALFEILYNFTLEFISPDIQRLYQESGAMGYISYLLHQNMVDSLRHRDLTSAKEAVVEAMKNHSSTNHLDTCPAKGK